MVILGLKTKITDVKNDSHTAFYSWTLKFVNFNQNLSKKDKKGKHAHFPYKTHPSIQPEQAVGHTTTLQGSSSHYDKNRRIFCCLQIMKRYCQREGRRSADRHKFSIREHHRAQEHRNHSWYSKEILGHHSI